ncbi:type II toxin-antitoxin system VapB family antitoxin [Oceanispirochaeta sp.]|jgi:antitoxin VapB|uniref:type II toxin-antitoxin system VapB family antitoxin n=1 Tax=Oceanispirochaeta sp. TaxID=2035350 RepID=UPI00261405DC|nr:type II toxin-antitoxin system VapB family antitoxin [Oceanispirochaeta sp.]MDA3956829.1 type II toxin-antitoxin system VapB family antitoxin [Oceanispirochaeta sp.]
MSISVRNPKVEYLAREIAEEMNISMTQAILEALEEKKRSLEFSKEADPFLLERIKAISNECASLPDLDTRSPDEILGYDQDGVFHGN